ncbi:hypothetical protein Esti_005494 [Eimeria stiedai]
MTFPAVLFSGVFVASHFSFGSAAAAAAATQRQQQQEQQHQELQQELQQKQEQAFERHSQRRSPGPPATAARAVGTAGAARAAAGAASAAAARMCACVPSDPSRLSSAQRALLHAAHECGALMFGSFTLKSGRTSPFFFDVGKFRDGRCLGLLAEAYASCIYESKLQYDVIFGPAYKGIPLACCTALILASRYGQQAPFVYDRKEEKDHGEGGLLVGASELLLQASSFSPAAPAAAAPAGENSPCRVLVVDDVLTSGTALKAGLGKILSVAPDAKLVALVVLLDRQEKQAGSELATSEAVAREFDTRVLSLLTVDHLLSFLDELMDSERDPEKKKTLESHKHAILQHRQIYGLNPNPKP